MNWDSHVPASGRARLLPKRYRITFANLGAQRFIYHVCSCLDDRKALVIAAEHHAATRPDPEDHVYEVIEVARVEGDRMLETDICDRAEW